MSNGPSGQFWQVIKTELMARTIAHIVQSQYQSFINILFNPLSQAGESAQVLLWNLLLVTTSNEYDGWKDKTYVLSNYQSILASLLGEQGFLQLRFSQMQIKIISNLFENDECNFIEAVTPIILDEQTPQLSLLLQFLDWTQKSLV